MAKATTPRKAAAAAPATATAKPAAPSKDTAVIKIDKEKHGATVRGAINGQAYELPTGSDVTVTAGQLASLTDSHVEFSTVTPLAGVDAAEGSAASTTVTGTAIRDEPAHTGPATGEDGKPLPTPELRQITDKELTDGADQTTSKESVEATKK